MAALLPIARRKTGCFDAFSGKTSPGLGTGDEAIVRHRGAADFEVGVIAGRIGLNPLFARTLGAENDGAVTVQSATLEGMTDFLVLPYSHTVMLWRREVIEQTKNFLRTRRFSVGTPPPQPNQ